MSVTVLSNIREIKNIDTVLAPYSIVGKIAEGFNLKKSRKSSLRTCQNEI